MVFLRLAEFLHHRSFQLLMSEVVAERCHDPVRPLIFESHLLQLVLEHELAIRRVFLHLRRADERRHAVDENRAIRMNDTGSEFNRRDVTFPGGPETEHEPEVAWLHARLIGVRDDRGVEKRGRFQCIFTGKQGADIKLARKGKRLVLDLRTDD